MRRVHGGDRDVTLDFSANINALGIPASVTRAVAEALGDLVRYPDPSCSALRRALAKRNGCRPEQVICGNGAAELIFAAVQALRPMRTLIAVPSFCEYQLAARAGSGQVVLVNPEPSSLDLNLPALAASVMPDDLLIVCSPNNPTGRVVRQGELWALVQAVRAAGATLLVDEAFIDFLPDWRSTTAARLLNGDGLIVLRSMTKFYAIPGLRLGYALTHPALVRGMEAVKDPWSVNTLAQVAGIAAVQDEGYELRTMDMVAEEREWLYGEFRSLPGLDAVSGASANFIMVRLAEEGHIADLRVHHGIAVRDCSSFDGLEGQYMRVAVKDRSSNQALVKALRSIGATGGGGERPYVN